MPRAPLLAHAAALLLIRRLLLAQLTPLLLTPVLLPVLLPLRQVLQQTLFPRLPPLLFLLLVLLPHRSEAPRLSLPHRRLLLPRPPHWQFALVAANATALPRSPNLYPPVLVGYHPSTACTGGLYCPVPWYLPVL